MNTEWREEALNVINQSFAKDELSDAEAKAFVAGYVLAKQLDAEKSKDK